MENGNEQKRQSQVNLQFNHANKLLENLKVIVVELGKRLERVLREPSPQNEAVLTKEEEYLVPIAYEIRDIGRSIGNQAAHLQDYIDRLEV